MDIREYIPPLDEAALFEMMRREGDEWKEIWCEEGQPKYKRALETSSRVFVAHQNGQLCGYIRCRDDDGFGVYIHDLLVAKQARGQNIGRALIDEVCAAYPDDTVYVMSDVDEYYARVGITHREGSVLTVQLKPL